jgi:hypothetical protein
MTQFEYNEKIITYLIAIDMRLKEVERLLRKSENKNT